MLRRRKSPEMSVVNSDSEPIHEMRLYLILGYKFDVDKRFPCYSVCFETTRAKTLPSS